MLPDLLVFLEVARAGSITGAASRLNTVQSNVTARIKKLETTLHASLLKRQARGIKLTPSGEAALTVALRLNAVLNDLRFTFGQSQAPRRAKLRLGAIETVAASQLPALVSRFSRAYPQVEIAMQTGSSASLLELVRSGLLEAAFLSRPPSGTGVEGKLVFEDELIVVAPANTKTLAELQSDRAPPLTIMVQRLGCSFTERLVTLLAKKSRRPCRMAEMGTLEGILRLVEAGMGIAAMPRGFVDSVAGTRSIARLVLPKSIRKLNTFLVTPSRNEASALINEFADFCIQNTLTLTSEPSRP